MLLLKGYHYLGVNGNIRGYFTDVLCGATLQNTEAGLYLDFIPDKGCVNLSDKRVCSPSNSTISLEELS